MLAIDEASRCADQSYYKKLTSDVSDLKQYIKQAEEKYYDGH